MAMMRRVFTFSCAMSLVVCVATAALWARSLWFYDFVEPAIALPSRWPARVYSVTVESSHGRLRLTGTVYQDSPDDPDADSRTDKPRWRCFRSSERQPLELELDHDHGDGYERESMHYPYGAFEWTATIIPHWHVVLWMAVLPGLWVTGTVSGWVAARRRRSRDGSVCAVCGYDLRATPNRCPECGAPFASSR